ncbi:MAG: hypothetical protein JNK58_02640 [Phycisphaerae bacterium]|nr:hypothetical protein [Phycisphaerae bacterium]
MNRLIAIEKHPARRSTSAPLLLLALGIVACGPMISACNIIGPALVIAEGPPKTDAKVELNADRTYIILVDDMRSRLPKRSLRDQIAQSAEEKLLEEGVLKAEHLIGARAVQRALIDDRSGKPKAISEIGRDAGANVVIYVTIDSWGITRDGRSAAPSVEGRVKLIDCDANKRIWPPNDTGYPLRVAPSAQQGDLPNDLAGRSKVEQDLARRYGTAIAQLFYKHLSSTSATK